MTGRAMLRALAASGALFVASGEAVLARGLCALRDGVCTCRNAGDPPGVFTRAARSKCGAAPAKPAAAANPAAPPATANAPAAPEPTADSAASPPPPAADAPVETGATATDTATAGAAPSPPAAAAPGQRRLALIRERGKVLCGVNAKLLGFAAQTGSGEWAGMDADFCRAIAVAALGDAAKVEFVPLETDERFDALSSGRIDLLSHTTTWTMGRDVDLGFDFPGVFYFDGQGFMTSAERGLVSAQQLAGLTVCVESGTTSEANMGFYFKAQNLDVTTKSFPKREDLLKAYADGSCDAVTGDRSSLFSERAAMAEPLAHAVLPEVISKEPLGPVTAEGDREWTEIVRWTLAGLVNAEEVGLDKAAASGNAALKDDAERLVEGAGASGEKIGLKKTWLRDVIAATGNYGELFNANLGSASPLGMERGVNALWKRGGLMYAPPMW